MKQFFQKRFQKFLNDWVLWGSSLFCFVILGFHIYQYIDSGFQIEPLIRIIFYSVSPFVIFFVGQKAIPILICSFMLITEQFNNFTNYTSFFCLAVSLLILEERKNKIFSLSVYIIDVVIVCERHGKTSIHLLIHFLGCIFIYCFVRFIYKILSNDFYRKYGNQKLNLSEKERFILSELAKGNKQKEISEYSENTVSKILKKCREKNNCSTNAELILKFISENPENPQNTIKNPLS